MVLNQIRERRFKIAALAVAVPVVLAFVLLQPPQFWNAEQAAAPTSPTSIIASDGDSFPVLSTAPLPAASQCAPGQLLFDPISQNTVSLKTSAGQPFTKTLHVEKEIFNCKIAGAVDKPTIYDVTIYTELIENMTTANRPLEKTVFFVVTCAKDPTTGSVLGCAKSLPTSSQPPTTTACTEMPLYMPQKMDTVLVGPVVKTVESQKEVFACNPDAASGKPTLMKDVVIFQIRLENVPNGTTFN